MRLIEFDGDAESSPEVTCGKVDGFVVGIEVSEGLRECGREFGGVAVAFEANRFGYDGLVVDCLVGPGADDFRRRKCFPGCEQCFPFGEDCAVCFGRSVGLVANAERGA